jgi:NAD-dependent SIR2 family protein deacetylase
MDYSEFLRIFEVRASNLNWFLGAGCSIAAGIPSAYDIIWDCKSRLYCSENGVPRSSVSDISNPAIQQVIQDYLETKDIFPKSEADGDDYTYYFEKAISSPSDRQAYIQELMKNSSPSYGHLVLASLAKISKAPIVWTTNFDKLYENSIFKVYGTSNDLVVADLGEPEKASKAIDARTAPLLVKLHGDFHSERLKNTEKELQSQDERMRTALSKACMTYGLCIIGYSGRDNSIMDVLIHAAEDKNNFPHGIFWFNKGGVEPLDNVTRLIRTALSNGIDAHIIEINNFDETLDQIRRYIGPFPGEVENILKSKESRLTESPIRGEARTAPYLRINAVVVNTYPTTCKLVDSDLNGGYKLIQEEIKNTDANIVARRIKKGIIVFGQDQEIKKAFKQHNVKRIQVYGIDQGRLAYPSEESKLVFDAFCKALSRHTNLTLEERRDDKYLIADKSKINIATFNTLVSSAVSDTEGVVPRTNINWVEACKVKLDYKFNRYWIVLEPRTLLYVDKASPEEDITKAKSFIKERTAPRWTQGSKIPTGYNQVMGSILAGWISIIRGGTNSSSISLPVLGINDNIDPVFEVSFNTVISGKVR